MASVELRTRVCGGYCVVMLRGALDTTDAESAARAVAALTADGQQLIIDLGALDFIDCHATGALLGVREAARQSGGDVLLAAPHGSVLRLLTLVDVSGVHPSVAAAVDSAAQRDARRLAAGIALTGEPVPSGTRQRTAARRLAVPGSQAGRRPGSPRWLCALRGLRG
jgi:anti-anti-sigma factor